MARRSLFHPDEWTFGDPIYWASQLIGRALAVARSTPSWSACGAWTRTRQQPDHDRAVGRRPARRRYREAGGGGRRGHRGRQRSQPFWNADGSPFEVLEAPMSCVYTTAARRRRSPSRSTTVRAWRRSPTASAPMPTFATTCCGRWTRKTCCGAGPIVWPTIRASRSSRAAAVVADILAFYQELYANEAYLRTAHGANSRGPGAPAGLPPRARDRRQRRLRGRGHGERPGSPPAGIADLSSSRRAFGRPSKAARTPRGCPALSRSPLQALRDRAARSRHGTNGFSLTLPAGGLPASTWPPATACWSACPDRTGARRSGSATPRC